MNVALLADLQGNLPARRATLADVAAASVDAIVTRDETFGGRSCC
ncbi:MAG: hypothetical protein ABSC56_09755 [Solirubrobacteraceae bacterium]